MKNNFHVVSYHNRKLVADNIDLFLICSVVFVWYYPSISFLLFVVRFFSFFKYATVPQLFAFNR